MVSKKAVRGCQAPEYMVPDTLRGESFRDAIERLDDRDIVGMALGAFFGQFAAQQFALRMTFLALRRQFLATTMARAFTVSPPAKMSSFSCSDSIRVLRRIEFSGRWEAI